MNRDDLLKQFRFFYFKNYPDDMEIQIEYFAIFGGLERSIDTTKPLIILIQELILDDFERLEEGISALMQGDENSKRLLRALAIGDRRIFSAFNRAGLNNGNGGAALKYLQEQDLLYMEYSREESPKSLHPHQKLKREEARHRISHKVLFSQPFLRFWFYFVSPYMREIAEGHYEEFFKNFNLKQSSYTSLIFEELSEVLLNYNLRDSQIVSSGSYWDAKIEIDIFTITDDESHYIGECKWTNKKVNRSEYHKLIEKCKKLNIEPTQILFFSKRGFSKELMSMQDKNLALYSCDDFEMLLKSNSYESSDIHMFNLKF